MGFPPSFRFRQNHVGQQADGLNGEDTMKLPRVFLARQEFPDRSLKDVPGEVRRQLETADFASLAPRGGSIAMGAGSRGIANIAVILKAVVDYWKARGFRPFIFPAMGSHGGATAEGQAAVLAHFGIVAESMGCPVISSLDVVPTGLTPEGIETFMDRHAFESDGVMLVGRVKWHTDFDGRIESGLCKMAAIGIGKLAGAQQYHGFGHRLGLERVIRSVFAQVAKSGKLLGGLAVLEDATHSTAQLAALRTDNLVEREEELLARVKSWAGRIPAGELDILIVDEIGKNISGAGMDTKVVNRSTMGVPNVFPNAPQVDRILVRDLSEISDGNAIGMGNADMVTDRLIAKVDWNAMYVNGLTSSILGSTSMPIHFPTDRECLERLAPTVGKFEPEALTLGWIPNTLNLGLLAFSENLLSEIQGNPALRVLSPPLELPWDVDGNLPKLEDWARNVAAAR